MFDWSTGRGQQGVPVHTDQESGGSSRASRDVVSADVAPAEPATCPWCSGHIQTSSEGPQMHMKTKTHAINIKGNCHISPQNKYCFLSCFVLVRFVFFKWELQIICTYILYHSISSSSLTAVGSLRLGFPVLFNSRTPNMIKNYITGLNLIALTQPKL